MKKYRSVYTADFETDNNKSKIFLCTYVQIYSKNLEVPLSADEEIVSCSYDFWTMLDDIVKVNFKKARDKTRNNKIKIYFTNSSRFDSYFIVSHLLERGYRQILYANNKTWKELEFKILENSKTCIKNLEFRYKGVYFTVQDFKLHVTLSVKQKGRVVGVDKGTYKNLDYHWISKGCYDCGSCSVFDYETCEKYNEIIWENVNWDLFDDDEKKAMIYYAKKDSLIDGLYIQKHVSTLGWPHGLTASSNAWLLAEKKVKEYGFKHNTSVDLHIINEDVWTRHMEGGFNYCNPNMLLNPIENAEEWDENGMYGYNMTQALPYNGGLAYGTENDALLLRINLKYFSLKREYRERVGQGIIKAPLVYHRDFEYSFLNKNFPLSGRNYIVEKWEQEWEWIQKMYELDFEIIEIKYFALQPFLRSLILDLNNKREGYKELCKKNVDYAVNYILQLDCKRNINSIYGKTTENPVHESYYYSKEVLNRNDVVKCEREKYALVVTGISSKTYFGNFKYICQNERIPEKRKNLYIGSYITMLGRVRMYEHLVTGNVARIDTDGLTSFNGYRPNNVGGGLGQMKLETGKMRKWFKLLGYKSYMWSDNKTYNREGLTMKGLNKLDIPNNTSWADIDWETVEGESINAVKTEYGVSLRRVKKKLVRQAIYVNALKEIAEKAEKMEVER